jgi:hypothetical protein
LQNLLAYQTNGYRTVHVKYICKALYFSSYHAKQHQNNFFKQTQSFYFSSVKKLLHALLFKSSAHSLNKGSGDTAQWQSNRLQSDWAMIQRQLYTSMGLYFYELKNLK